MSVDAAGENEHSRYVIGIDLGTTNSAVSFIDSNVENWSVNTFAIPQLVAPGQVETRETLPSFHYQAAQGEFPDSSLNMPWDLQPQRRVVGLFAREQGKLVPGRVIESAKSWLCHSGVDRLSPLLPWRGADDVDQLSPVDVSAAYLRHLREAWNVTHPHDLFEAQDVVITLPASFDEVARELTIQAARQAGIPKVILIEEPQAAFYEWINAHQADWESRVSSGQNILVCDVGGGTSDFTLIRVRSEKSVDGNSDNESTVQFHRIAVGNHLILGGDNLDLTLAQKLEEKLTKGGKLEPRQWGSLVRICRHAKETLLAEDAPESYTVNIPGVGRKLIGGGLQVEVSREEARNWLLEGFFPRVDLKDKPVTARSGFQEFGLPYASDAAITRYLAMFLNEHCGKVLMKEEHASSRPDVVLFNGGVFVSPLIRERVIQVIKHWYAGKDANWEPQVLANARHDLAVSRGAAYYGMVRRGEGVRIAAGLPRTYYIGVGSTDNQQALNALCLMPAGVEPGYEVDLKQHLFQLTISSPVKFPLFYSSTRSTDAAGELLPIEREQMSALPPIRTVLKSRTHRESVSLPVYLHARLTEIGTLQVWCSEASGSRTWQLQFDVRSATQTDKSGHIGTGEAAGVLDQESVELSDRLLRETFGSNATEKPGGLPKRIAKAIELSREDWPPSLLRRQWDLLMDLEAARKKSAEHEARWLNCLGYALRPGFGVAMDDWRVTETWKLLRGKLLHPGATTLAEWWVLWRRIAGGLPVGQQQAIVNPLLNSIRDDYRRSVDVSREKKPVRGINNHELSESWRMLGSMERLSLKAKVELGTMIIHFLDDPHRAPIHAALFWSLGRLGARVPFYGPLNSVVSIEVVSDWLKQLATGRQKQPEKHLLVMLLARRTDDRYRDIDESLRSKVVAWLTSQDASPHFITLVQEGGELAAQEGALVFGEALPVGLSL